MTLSAGDDRIVCLIAQRIKQRGCFAASGKCGFMEQLSEEHQGSAGWRSPSAPPRSLAGTAALPDSKALATSASTVRTALTDTHGLAVTHGKKLG